MPWHTFCDHAVTYVLWRTFCDVRSVTMPWRTFCAPSLHAAGCRQVSGDGVNFNDYVVPDAVLLSEELVAESNNTGTTVYSCSGLPLPIQRLRGQVSLFITLIARLACRRFMSFLISSFKVYFILFLIVVGAFRLWVIIIFVFVWRLSSMFASRKIWSAEELETLPAASHHRLHWGERRGKRNR